MNYNVCYFFLYIYLWFPMWETLTCFFTTSGPRGGDMYEESKFLEKKKRIDIPFANWKYLSALGIMPCLYTLIAQYIY